MKSLVIIDGNSILNRAYFAIKPISDPQGQNINAVYGFLNILIKILAEHAPDYLAVAFDARGKNFRHELYSEYKATRKGMPDDLAAQMPVLQHLLSVMGVKTVFKEGIEADDIIGTLVRRFDSCDKLIVTSDRDLLQLIDSCTRVMLTIKGVSEIEIVDEAGMQVSFGLTPAQVIDYKALRGDPSDNIPGVSGVGEKTAQSLIEAYQSLDGVYEHLGELKGAVRQRLEDGRDMAYLSRKLATIDTNADIACDFSACLVKPLTKAVEAELIKRGLRSLAKRLNEQGGALFGGKTAAETDAAADIAAPPVATQTQIEITQPEAAKPAEMPAPKIIKITTMAEFKSAVDSCLNVGRLALHIDQDIHFAVSQDTEYHIVTAKTFFDEIGFDDALSVLAPLLQCGAQKVVYDSKTLKHLLTARNLGVCGIADDVSIMQYLAEYRAYRDLPSLFAGYGIPPDALACGLLYLSGVLRERLISDGIYKLYLDIELPLAGVLFEMEREGVAVDLQCLDQLGKKFDGQIKQLTADAVEAAGVDFNCQSPKQLGEVLFERLKLPHGKKTKTGYSTNIDVLEELKDMHPLVPLVIKIRQLSKLFGTYIEGIRPLVKNGLIHTSFNQTLTSTGRLSSSEPNLQNLPIRGEVGREVRKMFMPKRDLLISADYSQIELRLLAHFSGDKQLLEVFNAGRDIHAQVASEIFGVPAELVTANMRRAAKAVNFGIIYGISDFGLSENIGVAPSVAKVYIKKYFDTYPSIKQYLESSVASARRDGYVTTTLGRRRQIPEINSKNHNLRTFGERAAMNMPLQGSSADIIKIAMLRVAAALEARGLRSRLVLQIHDELIVDAASSEESQVREILKQEMENAVRLKVNLTVNIESGGNLYESK